MSGITSLILSDKEVDKLVAWGYMSDADVNGTTTEKHLLARIVELQSKLACDGESCKI